MSLWTFGAGCRIRYDTDKAILVKFDYKAHFFEVDSHFFPLFHLLEQGATTDQLERFVRKHKESERGKLLAVIRDLENQEFLIEGSDCSV